MADPDRFADTSDAWFAASQMHCRPGTSFDIPKRRATRAAKLGGDESGERQARPWARRAS